MGLGDGEGRGGAVMGLGGGEGRGGCCNGAGGWRRQEQVAVCKMIKCS